MSDRPPGFKVQTTYANRILRLGVWGFWTLPIARDFEKAAMESIRELTALKRAWVVLADLSDYPPQNADVQAVHQRLMALAKKSGNIGAANVVSQALSESQIRRLSEQSGLPTFAFFTDEKKAVAWLVTVLNAGSVVPA